jgi:hypothetical protein
VHALRRAAVANPGSQYLYESLRELLRHLTRNSPFCYLLVSRRKSSSDESRNPGPAHRCSPKGFGALKSRICCNSWMGDEARCGFLLAITPRCSFAPRRDLTREKIGRGEWIRTTDLLVPNYALVLFSRVRAHSRCWISTFTVNALKLSPEHAA